MSREADFPLPVKEALAKRADNRCSFPQCPQATIGPSEEGPDKISNSGDAAHIVAASSGPGARRGNKNGLSPDQLKSIDNGIWMCTLARLIDRDEVTYTIPMLQLWRRVREQKARLRQQLGREIKFGPARSANLTASPTCSGGLPFNAGRLPATCGNAANANRPKNWEAFHRRYAGPILRELTTPMLGAS
jgi:hypothetical protein